MLKNKSESIRIICN